MKKISAILILGLLVLSVMPLAFAEDTNPTTVSDTEVEHEIQDMTTPEAAYYKIERLNLSIQDQIEHANDIIDELNASENVTSELEGYVAQLEVLSDRIQKVYPNSTPEDIAAEYMSIKKEAMTITQEFRKTVQDNVHAQRLADVKAKTEELRQIRRNAYNDELKNLREDMYATTMKGLLLKQLSNNSDIAEKLANNSLSKEEIKDLIKNITNNMTKEDKDALKVEVAQNKKDLKAAIELKKQEIKSEIEERRAEIKTDWQQRKAQKLAEIKADKEKRQQDREERRTELRDRLNMRSSRLKPAPQNN